jgi:hypothetical protein
MHESLTPRRLRALAALAWLTAGTLLLLLTPVSARSETWGWTPLFWLVLAPASILVAMQPRLPLALLRGVFHR